MKAMILAAGYGKRLAPLTSYLPKPLIPFANRPLIEYTLSFFKKYNINEIVINIHHLSHSISEYLGTGKKFNMKIEYSYEPEILGTGGGIKAVEYFFKEGPFIVLNGDILFNIDLDKALRLHKTNKSIVTLILRESQDAEKYGLIKVNKQGKVCKFLKTSKVKSSEPLFNAMFTGIQILEPSIFEYIPPNKFCGTAEDIYPLILKKGKLFGIINKGYWKDVGHHKEYLQAHRDILNDVYKLSSNIFPSNKIITGKNFLFDKKTILGPYTVIGNHCIVEDNSVVKGSVLWDNVHVSRSRLTDCIIDSNVTICDVDLTGKVVSNAQDGNITIVTI